MDRCKELGLICFSTPFDETAVDFLETLNVPCYKIASFEVVHLPLIKRIAQTGKPIIMSTGMASIAELNDAVKMARNNGCSDLILLKCTSSYPADPVESNILTIPHMSNLLDCQVGLSDHTLGIGVSVASVALGTTFIEKHFTLSRTDGGVDSDFSLEPEEMKNLVIETKRAWQALGNVCYKPSGSEEKSLQFRRSLYVAQDMKVGDIFSQKNLRVVRPGFGLPPKYYDEFLGKRVNCNLKTGTPVKWEMII
jgi:N-acetylneuraminate synthase